MSTETWYYMSNKLLVANMSVAWNVSVVVVQLTKPEMMLTAMVKLIDVKVKMLLTLKR